MRFKFWKKVKKQLKKQKSTIVYDCKMIAIGTCYLCELDVKTKACVKYMNKEKTCYKIIYNGEVIGTCNKHGTIEWKYQQITSEFMLCEKCRKAILKTIRRRRK